MPSFPTIIIIIYICTKHNFTHKKKSKLLFKFFLSFRGEAIGIKI